MTKNDKPKELKVTDKRMFTPEGELREEFRDEIKPASDPMAVPRPAPAPEKPAAKAAEKPVDRKGDRREAPRESNDRRRSVADQAPATPFTDFVQGLIAQAYMFLGMLRDPYQPKPVVDVAAARQMIDILTMLKEKTVGNLTDDEEDFLNAHLGELKLAFVQRTKSI